MALNRDEGNFLPFFQAFETVALNGAKVHKQIGTVFRGDETKSLKEGQKVTFIAVQGQKGLQADEVQAEG